jgi:predicted Holliday junction resolvase-like endonuclease
MWWVALGVVIIVYLIALYYVARATVRTHEQMLRRLRNLTESERDTLVSRDAEDRFQEASKAELKRRWMGRW